MIDPLAFVLLGDLFIVEGPSLSYLDIGSSEQLGLLFIAVKAWSSLTLRKYSMNTC